MFIRTVKFNKRGQIINCEKLMKGAKWEKINPWSCWRRKCTVRVDRANAIFSVNVLWWGEGELEEIIHRYSDDTVHGTFHLNSTHNSNLSPQTWQTIEQETIHRHLEEAEQQCPDSTT